MTEKVAFLMKDLVLLAVSFYLLKQDVRRVSLPAQRVAPDWLERVRHQRERGAAKVVLIDFWTYTCINWLRTLPYVRAWAAKYKNHGLVVIGVHSPEFEFEKDIANVRSAVKSRRVDYPVAVDSDYAIWHAFNNRYWPALYFIDTTGRIRHHARGKTSESRRSELSGYLRNERHHARQLPGLHRRMDWEEASQDKD